VVNKVAFLGPEGTFSDQARRIYDPRAVGLPCPSNTAVIKAVQEGVVDKGVVAIENSLEGPVNDTVDWMIHNGDGVSVCGELVISIEHCLLAKPGTTSRMAQIVFSHPQALGQCRAYLQGNFPTARLVASLSTVAAVQDMLDSNVPAVAVAPYRASEIYPVAILARGIQDAGNNETRFIVVGREKQGPTGKDKTSICFSFAGDEAGLLLTALACFYRPPKRKINLFKVESRPEKTALGRYIFLVDVEGHREDPSVVAALAELKEITATLKVFGSYPRWQGR